MKKILVLSAVAFAFMGAAQAQTSPTNSESATANASDPNRRICQNTVDTGSRVSRRRICMTAAEWEQARRAARQDVERAQTSRTLDSQ
jgi:hypothetical protein